jgi:hypothetical protein
MLARALTSSLNSLRKPVLRVRGHDPVPAKGYARSSPESTSRCSADSVLAEYFTTRKKFWVASRPANIHPHRRAAAQGCRAAWIPQHPVRDQCDGESASPAACAPRLCLARAGFPPMHLRLRMKSGSPWQAAPTSLQSAAGRGFTRVEIVGRALRHWKRGR